MKETISWSFLLGKMCITFHLYRDSDILLYLFKTNRVLWDWIIHGPPNIPVKCGMFHLYLFPVADTRRSSGASDSGTSVQTPYVDPKNLRPFLIVTSPRSVPTPVLCCSMLLPLSWLNGDSPVLVTLQFPCRRRTVWPSRFGLTEFISETTKREETATAGLKGWTLLLVHCGCGVRSD